MAPGLGLHASTNSFGQGSLPTSPYGNLRQSFFSKTDIDNTSVTSRRVSQKFQTSEATKITETVTVLQRRSKDELGATASDKLLNASYGSLMEWIRSERMTKLPAEGSHYDQLLGWVQLFAERLHSFEISIRHFATDSYLASQIAYGYCTVLLEMGEDNAHALMVVLGFFYNISLPLVNILDRAELFGTSSEIRDQLILAYSDLATLVASVATYFHKALHGVSSVPAGIDIYTTFSGPIESFRNRCDRITEDMWKSEILRELSDVDRIPEINTIKQWLSPEDWVIANLSKKASGSSHRREELTCLWVRSSLTRFLRGEKKGLSITGKSGSGKSVLASVILQHLQHPIAGKTYRTIYVPISRQTLVQASPLAVVKSLLYQLFHQRIGSVHLYQILDSIYHSSKRCADEATYEKLLWTALEDALAATQPGMKELVLVVDGVDETTGDADWLLKQLHHVVSRAHLVKLVTFSSHDGGLKSDHSSINVDAELNFDDIAAVVRSTLKRNNEHFRHFQIAEQEDIIDAIARHSDASFLWAKLVAKLCLQDKTAEAILKRVEGLEKAKSPIHELVARHIQLANLNEEAKHALVWLATAERPLYQRELAAILSIDTHKSTFSPRQVDVLTLLRPINSLIYTQDGLVALRHVQIRQAVRELITHNKLGLPFKDSDSELVRRLFIYMNSVVHGDEHAEPSLTALERHRAISLCDKHIILEYALRYWVVHISRATGAKIHGNEITLPKELASVFPSSVLIALLEMTLWERMSTPARISWHGVVTRLRRHLLSDKHLISLQSIITLSLLYQEVEDLHRAAEYYHTATVISTSVLTVQHIITMKLCTHFLEVTSTMTSETKTEIMIKREEVLIRLIECYKVHYGETSELVIATYTQLVEHYRLIKEESRAIEILKIVERITSTEFGGDVDDGRKIRDHLHIHFHKHGHHKGPDDGPDFEDEYGEDEVIEYTEFHNYDILIKLAAEYVAAGKYVLAEQLYIEIWQRSSQQCRIHQSSHWEIRKIEAVLAYARFLKTVSREVELNILLTSLWHEYETSTVTISETVITKLFHVAKYMKTVSMYSVALTVFKYCATHYESTSRTQTTSIYREIQEEVRSTTTEVTKYAASSSSSSSFFSESVFEEILYEATSSSSSSSSTTTITETTIKAILTHTQMYISQHRWHAARSVLHKVILSVWPEFFAVSINDVILPKKHAESCVELALRLARCYYWIRQLTQEEDIRVRLYRAFKSGHKTGDKLLESRIKELLEFYQRTSQTDRIITFRQELLAEYTKHYGEDHKVVIENLYILAELTRPRPVFVDYYKRIVTVLNKNSDVCKHEVVEPLIILAGEYWTQGRYVDALTWYKILFHTFLHHPKTHAKLHEAEFIRIVYQRYVQCLRTTSTEITIIHKVTQEFRAACKTTFGATVSITIFATLELARICQESRRFFLEAIALYEELLSIQSTEIDIIEIRETLDAIYEEQSIVSVTETMSSEQVEKAVSVLRRRITSTRSTYGWAHEESLSILKETINLYIRSNKIETAITELRETTIHVLQEETSTTKLIEAATTIASSYVACKQTEKAVQFCEHIYQAVIHRDATSIKEINIDISSRHLQALVILAQFEYMFRKQSTTTFNEIFAALSMEYSYYEEYRKHVKVQASFEVMICSTARLYLLLHHRRSASAHRLLEEFVSHFMTVDGKKAGINKAQAHHFVHAIIHYFGNHHSHNFFRSIHLAVNERVRELIKSHHFKEASELSLGGFYYLRVHSAYRQPFMILHGLNLGTLLAGYNGSHLPRPEKEETRKALLDSSRIILQNLLSLIKEQKINLGRLPLEKLNTLISVIGELKDYENLNWLLGILWNSREVLRNWPASALSALGARYILSRFLVGDLSGAVRLAEDIVYNLRRVRGPRHTTTLDMTTLLSQLYINVGSQYQGKNNVRIARSYYKKAATLHENVLRSFSDPNYADYDGSEFSLSYEGGDSSLMLGQSTSTNGGAVQVPQPSEGEHVRKHLQLLKLAIQRYGDWPKDYKQYESLNAELYNAYGNDLQGIEGVEKWNFKNFGAGKAESNNDMVDPQFSRWELETAN